MQNNHYLSPATGQTLTSPPQHWSRWLSFLTILLGMIPTLSQAQVGKVAEFSRASSDFITVPNAPYFGSDFTIETWVYPKTYNDDQPIFDFPVNGAKLRLHINYTNGQLSLFNGTTGFLSPVSAVPLQQWSHIAITVAGNTLKFYVNGTQLGATNAFFSWNPVANTTSTPFTIGKADPSGTDYADMYMDEFRVWKTARTQTEIQGAMNTALTGNENNLVLYYDMENIPNGNAQAMPNKVVTPSVPNFSGIFVGGNTTFAPQTFNYTGGPQTFTVPAGVYSITADVIGAKGANGSHANSKGGKGGRVQTTLAVTPGQVLNLYVGGTGINFNGGYNGGGSNNSSLSPFNIGGGGGASDIRVGGTALTNRIVIAGGGGGGGNNTTYNNEAGGDGGLVGGSGVGGGGTPPSGGTSTAGGSGGSWSGYNSGVAGSLGNGGAGAAGTNGAGGGGGYYGGGGGAWQGGGGGSSYSGGTATTYTTGYNNTGNGYVIISPNIAITAGKYGDGLDMNSNKIDLGYPHFSDQQLGGNYTVEGWVYPESNANNGLLYAATSSTSDSIVVGVSLGTTGKPFFRARIGGSVIGTIYPTTALPLNQWSHVAVSIYSSLVTLYVNGISVGTTTLTQAIPVLARNAQIGGNADIKVDEFHVWSVARTQAEIATGMAAQLSGTEANLYANYDMENAGSSTSKIVKNNSINAIFAQRAAQTNGNMRFFDPNAATTSLPNSGAGLGNALFIASAGSEYVINNSTTVMNTSANNTLEPFGFYQHMPSRPFIASSTVSYQAYDGDFRVEGWIKPKPTGNGIIMGTVDPNSGINTSSDFPFLVEYVNGQIRVSRKILGIAYSMTAPTFINDGKWHYVSINYDNYWNFVNSHGQSTPYYDGWNTSVYIDIDGVNVASTSWGWSTGFYSGPGATNPISCNWGLTYGKGMEGSALDEWRIMNSYYMGTSPGMNVSQNVGGYLHYSFTNDAGGSGFNVSYGSGLGNVTSSWNTPLIPASVQINTTPKTATISWNRLAGTLSYDWKIVERGAGNAAAALQSGSMTSASLNISTLIPGKGYDLYVKAKFAENNGNSPWSDAIPFTTQNDWKTALNFDGVNDFVSGPSYGAVSPVLGTTIEFWIRPEAGGGAYQHIVDRTTTNNGWEIFLDPSGLKFALKGSSTTLTANAPLPPNNQWTHVAAVIANEHIYLFINGKVADVQHFAGFVYGSNPATSIIIGKRYTASGSGAEAFKGSLDELRVWSASLTPSQIQTNMHQQPAANASGLMMYYKFDEASGPVATNTCTNVQSPVPIPANGDGTLTNFTLTGTTSNRVQRSPLVTTPTFANANVSSATVGASLITNGTAATTERGSVLAPTDNAVFSTVNAVSSAAAGTTTGVYTSNATSLAVGTTYYTRGYALSDDGIGYSPTVTGTTVCPAPNNAVVSNITASSATISWSNSAGYAAYSWRIVASGASVSGTAIGNGTGTAASPSVNVTSGLTQLSSYDVYLRGTCSGTNVSAWQGPVTFFVPCNNTTLPFAEAFTTTTTGTLPSCWRQLDLNTDNVTWSVSATKQASLVGGGVAMNDWLISSQGLPLTGGSSYKVTFKYNAIGSTAEKLMLAWGTAPTEAGLTNVIFDEANIVNTTATTITVLMAPTTTGTYYVGWKGYSDANSAGIMIDDINIDYNPCTTPVASSSIGITNIGGTTATASWNTIAGVTAYEWKIILAGGGNTAAAIFSGTSATGTTSLSGLTPAIEYDFYVRANCGTPIVSDWAGPKTFITLPIPLITATTADNDAYIDLAWSIPVSPCLLNGSGNPYPLGVHVQMKDAGTGAILKQESFPNLATFLGPQQPSFTYTAIGDANGYTVTNTTGSAWQSTLYNWTIESWVKTASTVANASILHATDNTGVNKLNLTLDGSNIKLSGTNLAGVAVNTTFTNTIPQNRWMHLAVAYNAASKKAVLYINGVEKETKTIENIIPSGNYKSMETFTDANMAELRFWNRTRTAAEISTSYLQTSFAGQAQNNLLLHWRWNTGSGQPTDLATNYDTQTNSATGGLTTVTYTATPQYIPITGDFRHWVGPSQTKNYQLNVIEIGSGATVAVCSNLSATGTTKAYQPVQLVNATDNLLEKVTLTWKNKSKMSEGFRILRAGKVVKVMSGTTQIDSIFSFTDTYANGDTNSIVNGTVYNYCVEAYNATFNATYPQLCNTGTTFNLNFAATDNAFTNKVNLSWANVSSYGYALNVLRDGVIIKTLDKNAVSYTDNSPYYGKNHLYGIALVNASNNIVVADYDNGGVTARGSIAGRVEALAGKYGMPNIKVKLNSLVDTTFSDSVYTNYKGEFAFNNLYYGLSGEFTLTASKAGHTFAENPKTVTISNANYVVSNVVFVDSFILTPDANTLAITNFQATAVNTADKVDLTWTYPYTAADTTIFNIYRENTLLATLTDLGGAVTSFTDFTGFPNQYYLYKIVGYRLTGNTVLAGMDTTTRQFPAVTKPTNFVVTPNTTIGNVALSWANTSTNFEGFNLYRNGAKIADLDKYAVAYTDVDGQPSTAIVYSIKAKRKFTDLTEESAATTAASINFPTLSAPTSIVATANSLRNSVTLSWTIPTVLLNLNYNYDGYRIYRKDNTTNTTVLIGQIAKSFPLAHEDKEGIPSRSYTYSIKTYVKLGNNLFESAATTANPVTFPVVRALTGTLTASTNTLEGEVSLAWTSSSYALGGRNLDGQIVMKGNDTLAFVPLTANAYRVFTNNTTATTYSVRTYRKLNGVTYLSAPISNAANTGKPAIGTTAPEFVTNFKASQDLPNHVRLNWAYPAYIYSTFKVYRDNVLIATLSTDYRTYYDDNATQGATHLYQVEAINGANVAQKVGSWGKLKSICVLQGIAEASAAGYGMPNVEVVASATNFYARTFTDSAGYYKFDNVPQDQSLVVNVKAEGPNCTFSLASQNITIGTAKMYNVNFLNTYTPNPTDTLTPAKPAFVRAISDYAQRQVTVTWNPANTQYDGFEVYRANTLLGSITKGNDMVMHDDNGYAGVLYGYSVRGYVEGEGERIYSDAKALSLVFPLIDTVVYLTADLFSHANSVNLTWSHRWDNHTYYLVERNGEPVDTIMTGESLNFTDNKGAPGQLYTYTVTAVMNESGKNYTSIPVSVQVTYPGIAEITNLTGTIPLNITTPNIAPCNVMGSRNQNAVKLTWNYDGLNNGFKVYRNNEYLGRVAKDTLHYTDIAGIPGLDAQYTVRAVVNRDSIDFVSPGNTITANFPNISTPYKVKQDTTATNASGIVYLRWEYPEDAASGFYIFRGLNAATPTPFDTVAVDSFTNGKYYYTDKNGGADLSYTYYLQTYSKRNNVTYYSDKYQCLAAITYPKPAAPTMCAASDSTYTSYIKVSWVYPVENNLSGFEIYRDNESVGSVTAGMRTFFDKNAPSFANYTVKAFRTISNVKYYSNASNSDIGSTSAPANYLTLGTQTNKRFGRAVSAEQDVMVVGAPGFGFADSGYVRMFKFDFTTRTWTPHATIAKYEEEFGRAVSISVNNNAINNYYSVVVGAPAGNKAYNYYFYPAGGVNFVFNYPIVTNVPSAFSGFSVAAKYSGYNYVGSPKYNSNQGLIYIQQSATSGSIAPSYINGAPAAAELGYSMDIGPANYLVLGAPGANKVYINYGNLSSNLAVTSMSSGFTASSTNANDRLGHAVGVGSNGYFIAGAPNHSGTGRAFIDFLGTSATPLVCPDCSPGDKFGWSVDVEGDWAIVGAPAHNSGRGAAYLYRKTGVGNVNTWAFTKKFSYASANDSVGVSVDITDKLVTIGSPNADNGNGRVYWELLDGVITNFAASDGTFADKTKLTWEYYRPTTNISGFNLYRDGTWIATAAVNATSYEDADGLGGKTYVYEIAPVATGVNSTNIRYTSDEGFRKADGSITGDVVTLQGGGGVAGVAIKAVANIDGNFYTYNTTSDINGHYAMSNVYYTDSTTFYALTADYKNHIFNENPIGTYITPPLNFAYTKFYDKTAFVIGGNIQREGAVTGLDSIQVTPVYVFADNSKQQGTPVWSDKKGKYTVTVDPYKVGLSKIIVQIDSSRSYNNGKTIYYHFKPVGIDTIADVANLSSYTKLDFADTTRYPVMLSVMTACSTTVTGGKFQIHAVASDGSFEQTYTTNLNGTVTAYLPPYDYTLSVEGVENLNIPNELVVNYLRYRPLQLPLATLDRDTARDINATTMTLLTARQFLYHKPPTVELKSAGAATEFSCGTQNVYRLAQGQSYTFEFAVTQNHNGGACNVQTGYITVTNAGATKVAAEEVKRVGDKFSYTFIAGNPNLVNPYRHLMTVRYYSDSRELLGEKNFALLVTGEMALPGSDVIIELSKKDNVLNLPLFVLRDPPGDGSSSTLEAGSTITSTYTNGNSEGGQAGIYADLKGHFGPAGLHYTGEILSGSSLETERGWELSVTNNKAISTSDGADFVGEDADILVGAGFGTKYGIVQSLQMANCSTVVLTNNLGLSLDKFESEWVYTIGHIKILIAQYEQQLVDIDKERLVLKEGNDILTKEEATNKVNSYINNWKAMLKYHQNETLPHVNFCKLTDNDWGGMLQVGKAKYDSALTLGYNPEDLWGSKPSNADKDWEDRKTKVVELQKEFCKAIGSDTPGANWTLNSSNGYTTVWSGETMNKYNNTMEGVRQLVDIQNVQNWVWETSAENRTVTDYASVSTQVLLHGKQAKNVTFSGGTNYSETFESENTASLSMSQEINLDVSLGIGVWWAFDVSISGAPFGIGVVKNEVEIQNEFGITGEVSFAWSESRSVAQSKSNLISFSLVDDDPSDQFSVNVIQGISTSHTPFFQLVGGRSSCPQEAGTIYRDRPNIALIDTATKSTSQAQIQEHLAPEETAVFQAQLANLSVFYEERNVLVGLDPSSNPHGAVVTMGGVQLGVDLVPFTLEANKPLNFPILVSRGPIEYEYDSLMIQISPECDEGDLLDTVTIKTQIFLSAHFESPCSEINILEPDDHWTINRRDIFNVNSRELLPIKLVDYDPTNDKLAGVRVEYRRKGSNQWTTMNRGEFDTDSLARHNSKYFLPGQVPYYLHIWDITDDYTNFPDGEYEIRAVADCEASGHLYSKTLSGVIDRSSQLLTNPEPADHVWTNGDEISVNFNKNLDCAVIADSNFVVRSLTQANTFLPGLVGCYEHKLIFTPQIPVRYFDGDTLQIVVAGVKSYNGNLLDTVRWDFVVQGKDLYVKNNRFEVSVNQGDSVTVSPVLVNNRESNTTIDYAIDLSGNTAWLSSENATGKVLANYPETVNLNIASANLPLGDKVVALAVTGDGFPASDSIYLTVHVLPVAPHWDVNPANYSQSMTVLSNYILNSNAATKSTDSMDMISVWIDNSIRGVAKLSKVNATEYTAIIQTYGDAADAGKALSFRVWDSSTATEYDAKPVGTNVVVNFANNAMIGGILSPMMLNVNTASDKARYIPLNAGWTMFSVNTNSWNKPVNQTLASLKHPHVGDLIKTATKSAAYTGTTWLGTGGTNLDSTNVHRGYQIYLQEADTIRMSGANATIKPIALQQGWNLVGMPLQTETPLATALNFFNQPDSIKLKTVAQNPSYSTNMVAFYQGNTWFAPNGSNMDKVRPYFAYMMKVNTANSELLYPGYVGNATPVVLRTAVAPFDNYDHDTWKVFAPDYAQNMLITATVDYNKTEIADENSLVAAYVGTECRGVGKITYVPELKKHLVSMFVYTNNADEIVDFRIYDAKNDRYFDNHEPMTFRNDSIVGRYSEPYHFSNVALDNSFNGSVYPNPFSHKFSVNLKSDKAQTYQIQLLDIAGHLIEKVKIDTESTDISHTIRTDALDLPSGVYILQVKGSLGETRSFKLVHNEE